jgi:hypothetical protein
VRGGRGKNFDTSGIEAQAGQEVAALNAQMAALGIRFDGGAFGGMDYIGGIGGGQSGNPRSLNALLSGTSLGQGIRASDSRVQTAIGTAGGGTVQGAITAAQQAQALIGQLDQLAASAAATADPLEAIRRQFDAARASAIALGFGLDEVNAAQERALEQARRQQRETAAGAALGPIGSLTDYARSLRSANDNAGNPMSRLDAAFANLNADLGPALGSGDLASIGRLSGSAERYRQLAREVYGTGTGFADAERYVTSALQGVSQISPEMLIAQTVTASSRDLAQVLTEQLQRLIAEVAALRREQQQSGNNPLLGRAA